MQHKIVHADGSWDRLCALGVSAWGLWSREKERVDWIPSASQTITLMFDLRPPNSKIVEILGLIQGSIFTTAKMSVFLLPKQNPETTEKNPARMLADPSSCKWSDKLAAGPKYCQIYIILAKSNLRFCDNIGLQCI